MGVMLQRETLWALGNCERKVPRPPLERPHFFWTCRELFVHDAAAEERIESHIRNAGFALSWLTGLVSIILPSSIT